MFVLVLPWHLVCFSANWISPEIGDVKCSQLDLQVHAENVSSFVIIFMGGFWFGIG